VKASGDGDVGQRRVGDWAAGGGKQQLIKSLKDFS